jgi:hypothetical protein
MATNVNHILGLLCITAGSIIILFVLGDFLFRVIIGLLALSLINYGLRLRGLPSLPLLIQLMASRRRFF